MLPGFSGRPTRGTNLLNGLRNVNPTSTILNSRRYTPVSAPIAQAAPEVAEAAGAVETGGGRSLANLARGIFASKGARMGLAGAAGFGLAKMAGGLGNLMPSAIDRDPGESGVWSEGLPGSEEYSPEQVQAAQAAHDDFEAGRELGFNTDIPESLETGEEPPGVFDGDEMPPPVTPTWGEVTAKKGDSLSSILMGLGVSQDQLPQLIGDIGRGNNFNPDQIAVGQKIDLGKRMAGPAYQWNGGSQKTSPLAQGIQTGMGGQRGGEIPASIPLPSEDVGGVNPNYEPHPNFDALMGQGATFGRRPANQPFKYPPPRR